MEETDLEQVRQLFDACFTHFLKKQEETQAKPEKGYFTIAEAAVFVACSIPHVRRHVTGGTLPVANIGTNDGPDYRVSRADLVAWMEKRKAGASPPPRRKKGVPVEDRVPFSPHRRPSKNSACGTCP